MSEYIYEIVTDCDGVDCYINRGEIVRCSECRYMVEEIMSLKDKHPKYFCTALEQHVIGSFFCGNGGRMVNHG